MNVTIKGVHLDVTDSMRDAVTQKIIDPLKRMASGATSLEIQLKHNGHNKDHADFQCAVTLKLPHHGPIHIAETDSDLYRAIDKSHDTILAKVRSVVGRDKEAHVQSHA